MTKTKIVSAIAATVAGVTLLAGCSVDEAKTEVIERASSAMPDFAKNHNPSQQDIKVAKELACAGGRAYLSMDENSRQRSIGLIRAVNDKLRPISNRPEIHDVAQALSNVAADASDRSIKTQRQGLYYACS